MIQELCLGALCIEVLRLGLIIDMLNNRAVGMVLDKCPNSSGEESVQESAR